MKYIRKYEKIIKLGNPFVQTAERGNNNKIKEMLKNGEDPNQIGNYGKTALMAACLNSFLLIVKTLLENGADPNLMNKDKRTALMMSSTPKIIDLLLKYGANVNSQNNIGETVLMEQAGYINQETIIELIEKFSNYGLDLDLVDEKGKNFYERLLFDNRPERFYNIIQYMDINYPKYREKYQFDLDIKQFNL